MGTTSSTTITARSIPTSRATCRTRYSCHELRPLQGDRKDDNVSIADIVSSEEEWVYHGQMPWKSRYQPCDFMGVSSKEYCGQCVSEANAVNRTIEAWDTAASATTFQQTGTSTCRNLVRRLCRANKSAKKQQRLGGYSRRDCRSLLLLLFLSLPQKHI